MPKVLMYYSYGNKIGGPLTYINTIINSPLKDKYEFVTCYQNEAPGGWNGKMLKRMISEIKKEKPDIVHVHGAQSEGFYGALAARRAGCRNIVMTVHGFAFDASSCRGIKRFLYRHIIEPLSLRWSKQVYCVCKFASERKIVQKNTKKRCYGYIHNPVTALSVDEERSALRARYGIADNDIVFCISGRISRDKGFDLLAQAVKKLNAEGKGNFKMLVIGDGPYRVTFSEIMKDEIAAGQIIFSGHTNKVANHLAAADAFVFPSYHENLSIALLEACASSLPAIVFDVGGNAEIITDGEVGYVLKDFSADDFADRMTRLIEDPELRTSMGKRAKEDVLERFSLEEMCKKIDEVYQNALR